MAQFQDCWCFAHRAGTLMGDSPLFKIAIHQWRPTKYNAHVGINSWLPGQKLNALPSKPLFLSRLYSTHRYSTHRYSTHRYSTHRYSTHRYSTHRYSTHRWFIERLISMIEIIHSLRRRFYLHKPLWYTKAHLI